MQTMNGAVLMTLAGRQNRPLLRLPQDTKRNRAAVLALGAMLGALVWMLA